MGFEVIKRGKAIILEGEMTIYFAGEIKSQLLTALDSTDGPITLDMSRVSELDTAGLQILLMARMLARSRQRQISLRSPSDIVRDVLTLCGLNDHLEQQKREVA